MEYPTTFYRGIPNSEFLDQENQIVKTSLFIFKTDQVSAEGFHEQSINWNDDPHALDILLSQRKNDQIQFKAGAAEIETRTIDDLRELPALVNNLSYERHKIDSNPYHGNLLLAESSPKVLNKMIAASIALRVHSVLPNPNDQSA